MQNEQEAAAAVIAGEPVASMGGFTGRETVLTNSYLARLISRHEARYFLLGGQTGTGGPGGTSNAAVSTITSICKAVSTGTLDGLRNALRLRRESGGDRQCGLTLRSAVMDGRPG